MKKVIAMKNPDSLKGRCISYFHNLYIRLITRFIVKKYIIPATLSERYVRNPNFHDNSYIEKMPSKFRSNNTMKPDSYAATRQFFNTLKQALLMSKLCGIVYTGDPTQLKAQVNELGFTKYRKIEDRVLLVFLEGQVIVVNRGTSDLKDLYLDICAVREKFTINNVAGKAHRSLLQLMRRSLFNKIVTAIDEEYGDKNPRLVVTGHSLGAGMSQIFSLFALARGYKVDAVYLFGSMNSLSRKLLKYLKSKVDYWSFTNNTDLIPAITSIFFPDKSIVFSSAGEKNNHPKYFFVQPGNRWTHFARVAYDFGSFFFKPHTNFEKIFSFLFDHRIQRYYDQISKMLASLHKGSPVGDINTLVEE